MHVPGSRSKTWTRIAGGAAAPIADVERARRARRGPGGRSRASGRGRAPCAALSTLPVAGSNVTSDVGFTSCCGPATIATPQPSVTATSATLPPRSCSGDEEARRRRRRVEALDARERLVRRVEVARLGEEERAVVLGHRVERVPAGERRSSPRPCASRRRCAASSEGCFELRMSTLSRSSSRSSVTNAFGDAADGDDADRRRPAGCRRGRRAERSIEPVDLAVLRGSQSAERCRGRRKRAPSGADSDVVRVDRDLAGPSSVTLYGFAHRRPADRIELEDEVLVSREEERATCQHRELPIAAPGRPRGP